MPGQGDDSHVTDIKPMTDKALREVDPLRSLLPKQRKFLKHFLKTKNRVIAWKLSHKNCKSDASAMSSATAFLSAHPEVNDWLYQLAGLGDDDFIGVVRDSFTATRQQIYKGTVYKEPDHYARLKGVELGMKMRGIGGGKEKGNTMNIQIISDKQAGVFKIIEGEEA